MTTAIVQKRAASIASLRRRLLDWFRANARPLPWRTTRDPYRIWISEVMLQQTQVVTVVPRYKQFLKQFPTLSALAKSSEQTVLRAWEGLGYYRRARDLLRAARILADKKHKTIPDDPEFVRSLPGFGRYTTNAVLSQAYDRRLPILEANSQRLLCRLFGIEQDPRQTSVQKRLWRLAESLAPSKSAGDFNQALMELGALICKPTQPACGKCPLRGHCQARMQERQHEIPQARRGAKTVEVREAAVVIRKSKRVLLVKRPDGGRWAGLWEFPRCECLATESAEDAVRNLLSKLHIKSSPLRELATIHHTVTRFQIALTAFQTNHRAGKVTKHEYAETAWVPLADLHAYPLATPQRKLARSLTNF